MPNYIHQAYPVNISFLFVNLSQYTTQAGSLKIEILILLYARNMNKTFFEFLRLVQQLLSLKMYVAQTRGIIFRQYIFIGRIRDADKMRAH